MGDNVLKTPVLIEAETLTDVMGNPRKENVQLILQILSSRIRVTTCLTEWAYKFTIHYDKLTIKPNRLATSFVISMIESERPQVIRSLKITLMSQELLKAWFLSVTDSVTDRSWPLAPDHDDADDKNTEKNLFDFLQQKVPRLVKTTTDAPMYANYCIKL